MGAGRTVIGAGQGLDGTAVKRVDDGAVIAQALGQGLSVVEAGGAVGPERAGAVFARSLAIGQPGRLATAKTRRG